MTPAKRFSICLIALGVVDAFGLLGPLGLLEVSPGSAQTPTPVRNAGFTIPQVLSPAFPFSLVGARRADRITWIENERGMRNVYAATAPDYTPVRLTATMTDDGRDLSGAQISDDGSVVIFIRGHTPNFKGQIGNQSSDAEGGRREIWAASTSGARPPWRVVAALNATLSPDGKWVVHVKDGQIHRAAVDPGNTDPALLDGAPPLFVTLGVNSSPVWSPDGRKIAFVSARYDQRQYFPTQGLVTTHSFIAVYDLESRRVTYMAPSVDRDTSPVWSPDGTKIAFMRRPGLPYGHFATAPRQTPNAQIPPGFLEARFQGGYTLGIWVADVATETAREVWHNAPGDQWFEAMTGLRWAGDRLLFEAEPNNWGHVFSVSATGPSAEPVLLTPGEGEVENVALSPDGRFLYYSANIGDLDRRHLFRVPVGGGRSEQITRGDLIETVLTLPGSGANIATLQAGPRQPLTIALIPAAGGQGRIIGPRPPAEFPAARHVVPTTQVIRAADGLDAHSIVYLPADLRPGERRPALLYIHGGGGRSVLGYPDQNNGFYHMSYGVIQYFVNKGYIVASVNYRGGSALYGRAFRNPAEYSMNGVSEYRDVLAAGQWLKARPDVDPERLGVFGLSYGGWLTGQALSRNSDIFKAGAIFAGVQLRSTSLDEGNLAYQSSPAYNIEKWTSPTLVIHGDDDRNVEFSQTIGLISLFRAHNVPHELIVYPDDTHYFGYFNRWIRAFTAIDDFFDRNLLTRQGVRTSGSGGR
jgi:dipeptidyl-peptidase-4